MVKKVGWIEIDEKREKMVKKLNKEVKPKKIPPAEFENLLLPGNIPLGPMDLIYFFVFNSDAREIKSSKKFSTLVELADNGRYIDYWDCLKILNEKGRKIAPLDEVYKNLFRPELKFNRWEYNVDRKMKKFYSPLIGGITSEYLTYNGEIKFIGRNTSIQKDGDRYSILVDDYKVKPEDKDMESFVEEYLRENSDIPSDVKINIHTIYDGFRCLMLDSDSTYKRLEISTSFGILQPIFVR